MMRRMRVFCGKRLGSRVLFMPERGAEELLPSPARLSSRPLGLAGCRRLRWLWGGYEDELGGRMGRPLRRRIHRWARKPA
jgi:hypothetical protein